MNIVKTILPNRKAKNIREAINMKQLQLINGENNA
jgi:hypothetical protein